MLTLCGNNASLVIFLGWVGPPPQKVWGKVSKQIARFYPLKYFELFHSYTVYPAVFGIRNRIDPHIIRNPDPKPRFLKVQSESIIKRNQSCMHGILNIYRFAPDSKSTGYPAVGDLVVFYTGYPAGSSTKSALNNRFLPEFRAINQIQFTVVSGWISGIRPA